MPPEEETRVIRPAAILDERTTVRVMTELSRLDVANGGLWNASSSLWQRYDKVWDGLGGTRGNARLIGSIAVMYDAPHRHQITIYKVTITVFGKELGWDVNALCDDALTWVGLTLESCPRAELTTPPERDPFKRTLAERDPRTPRALT